MVQLKSSVSSVCIQNEWVSPEHGKKYLNCSVLTPIQIWLTSRIIHIVHSIWCIAKQAYFVFHEGSEGVWILNKSTGFQWFKSYRSILCVGLLFRNFWLCNSNRCGISCFNMIGPGIETITITRSKQSSRITSGSLTKALKSRSNWSLFYIDAQLKVLIEGVRKEDSRLPQLLKRERGVTLILSDWKIR